ncbi:glycerol-3-phosphate dehydrogenase [NAD(P)+] [Betaproteobacteria bacterium]|nr:glycerol-3-phosphate dehydrogenase [NAD(P)+] [Betaproteobacteria bacterium]GHU41395.1 glycerol-3-phosphate dehydrogenase [NAD(P)+] [Betaproteobacteria bacterium]
MKITILAAGAWGTALAIAFSARHQVTLWARESDLVDDMRQRRENVRFLPGFALPPELALENELATAGATAEVIIIATPIAGLRPTAQSLAALGLKTPLLWICKGFEVAAGKLPHEVIAEALPDVPGGMLSGPSFAQEVAAGLPTALTLASNDRPFAHDMALALHGGSLRIYASHDLIGVEVGGAVKNILAIATGICDSLKLGFNARAALMTRGLAEIARLGVALGAKKETFLGLSGVGDLILTCTGDLSRNRRVGQELASGKSLQQALADLGHVAEGVPTALAVHQLAGRLGVDMPITAAVAALLEGKVSVRDGIGQLLSRDPAEE